MAQHKPPPPTVAELLRAAMVDSGISQRKLARLVAGKSATDKQVEHKRRQISKWLNGTRPGPASAKKLSAALGKPESYFVTRGQPTDLEALRVFVVEQLTEALQRIARLEQRLDESQSPPRGARGSR